MAGTKSGVKAFRSEVDMLRNVIRRTVNEVIDKKLRDTGGGKPAGPVRDLSPLAGRIGKLEREIGAVRDMAGKGVKELVKGKDIEGLLGGITESKLGEINKKIRMFGKELEMLRSQVEDSNVKKFEEKFQREMGAMKSQVNKVIIDGKGLEERLSSEMEDLKNGPGIPKPEGGQVKGPDMEELRRDLEIIKTKQEWIENNIERIDIKPLLRKMEELEHKMRVIRVSSPIILE